MADKPEAALGKQLNTLMILVIMLLLITTSLVVVVVMMKMGQTHVEEPDLILARPEMGKTYSLGNFVTNLADVEPPRFIKTAIEIEYSKDNLELDVEIRERLPQFKDMVGNVLGDRHSTELLDAQGKSRLKEELMDMINNVLKKGRVTSLYMTDFAVQ